MAIRRLRDVASEFNSSPASKERREKSRQKLRKHLLETLEERRVMAAGPQLIGIQPNNSDLLVPGDVRQVAPRELVFRFDDTQVIDAATLSGIRVSRSGGDGRLACLCVERLRQQWQG